MNGLASLAPLSVRAANDPIYKCIDANQHVAYTDIRCGNGESSSISVPEKRIPRRVPTNDYGGVGWLPGVARPHPPKARAPKPHGATHCADAADAAVHRIAPALI